MSDPIQKTVQEMSRDEYKRFKRATISDIARTSAEQRDQKVLDALAGAKDDAERRRILRQFAR